MQEIAQDFVNMQAVENWDEQYILNLPAEQNWIEFKGARALDLTLDGVVQDKVLKDLSIQLSAFANSGGGIIVYGVKDPLRDGPGVDNGGVSISVKNPSTKEWLEDVIPSLVDVPLTQFSVIQITGGQQNSQIVANKAIYLIQIGDSEQAPHQAKDSRYYIRIGGKSSSATHRLVQDIFGRRKYPKIIPQFFWKRETDENCSLSGNAINAGKVYANYVNGTIFFPKLILPQSLQEQANHSIEHTLYLPAPFINVHRDKVGTAHRTNPVEPTSDYYISRYDPILPNQTCEIKIPNIILSNTERHNLDAKQIHWEIYADSAPVEIGKIELRAINIKA